MQYDTACMSLIDKKEVRDKRKIMAGITFRAPHSLVYHFTSVHGALPLGPGLLGPVHSI